MNDGSWKEVKGFDGARFTPMLSFFHQFRFLIFQGTPSRRRDPQSEL
jgi:hypothetical protein